ncbi:MAG: acyl-CoA synthetase [Candidatus Binatia bacterium]|nr:MAG: acyl-CoA synthetase [Candidatus Binatia bacterium]
MSPTVHAKKNPEKPAYIMASTGETVTYGQLEERSARCARLFRSLGLREGDSIAFCLENHPRFFEITWAAQRSGLYYTPISSRLTASEVEYIVGDCGAKVFLTSVAKADVARELVERMPGVRHRFLLGGELPGYESYEEAVRSQPADPLPEEREGQDMLYSSGTTGRPKGVKFPLSGKPFGSEEPPIVQLMKFLYGADENMVYLSPAPLYHAAPLRFCMTVHRIGGTCVVMERFDPAEALALVERYRVTHSQWVPTMFVRMLRLPEEIRKRYDLSSLRYAIHAAAPCPIPVKEQMIEWWGPILYEYYAGTEGNGFTAITSEEWLQHKGSVGKPLLGEVHILDDEGNELPPRQVGTIYFAGGAQFEYHNDPEKTRQSRNEKGWSTLGDMGYVDEDGYLYLTDRKAYMIISGGVNIYPQEIENVLILHPKVADVAVFGVPNEDLGEEVKAVVQPVDMAEAGEDLARELMDFCRKHLAKYKCPRSIDFEAELPRHPTGKLYKRLLRDRYWQGHETRIV